MKIILPLSFFFCLPAMIASASCGKGAVQDEAVDAEAGRHLLRRRLDAGSMSMAKAKKEAPEKEAKADKETLEKEAKADKRRRVV